MLKRQKYSALVYAGTSIHLLYIRLHSASDTSNAFMGVLQSKSCIERFTQQLYLIITGVRLVVGSKEGQSPLNSYYISNIAFLDKPHYHQKRKRKTKQKIFLINHANR